MQIFPDWAATGITFPARVTGSHFDTTCPQCSATRTKPYERCLYVNVVDQWFLCHHCEWHGKIDQPDWRDGAPAPRPVYKPSQHLEQPDSIAPWVVEFFAARGIERRILERHGVHAGKIHDGKTDVIVIPFKRDGVAVTAKYRYRHLDANGKKRHEMEPDTEKIPFGIDDCAGAEHVVIVEGEPDKFAVEQATGITAVLSPPNGATLNDATLAAMVDACGDATVTLAGDMDEKGMKMQSALAERIGFHRCRQAQWPCKDANDTLVQYGPDKVRQCIEEAKPFPVAGIVTIDDLSDDIDRLYELGMPAGEPTGWPALDRFYTVREGQLTIVTGAPGSGKSVWLDALLVNLSRRGWKAGIFSPESQPLARHAAYLIANYIGRPFGTGPTERMTVHEKDLGKSWLRQWCTFVMPEENTVDSILERMKTLKEREGIRAVVIDPWTEIDHSRPNNMTETEFIHGSLAKIREFGRNHKCHVWVVAHPKKQFKENGTYPVILPYDISGSAAWFNKADNIISVWRNKADESQPVEIHVQKVRFHEIGGLGMAQLRHDKLTGRYWELS